MSRFNVAAVSAVGVLVGLSCPDVSRGEDLNPSFMIPGPSWNAQVDKTRPGSFMPQLPGSKFVVTIAHIGPSPEDAVVKGRLRNCDAVQFRLDTLKVISNGAVDVELGTPQTLAPGESFQAVYDPVQVEQANTTDALAQQGGDQVGFRLRSKRPSSICSVVASGLFYADSNTTAPIPFAIIPSVSTTSKKSLKDGR